MNHIKNRLIRVYSSLKEKKGFSLIEIMIAITIIAIIGAIVVPRLMKQPQKARYEAAKNQIKNFELALLQYTQEKGKYPTSEEGLQVLVSGKIMKKLPKDPWGNDYVYRSPGEADTSNDYEIMSYGADGKEGGEGYNKDIKSWE